MTPRNIFLLIIIVLFIGFVAQNAEVVEIRFLFWSFEASRAIILLMTYILGIVTGYLAVWVMKTRKNTEN